MDYYHQNQYLRNDFYFNSPYPRTIKYPRFNEQIRKPSIINLSKIIETTQVGINTINQIIPIYKQATPIIKQISNFTKSMSNFFIRNKPVQQRNEDFKQATNSNKTSNDYRSSSHENNPFFK